MQFLYKLSSLRSPLLLKFTLTTDFWHNLLWQQNNITNSRLGNWLGTGSDPMHCVHLLAVSQTILCGEKNRSEREERQAWTVIRKQSSPSLSPIAILVHMPDILRMRSEALMCS